MSNNNEFLPTEYEVPKGESSYLKFQTGENKFRILSKPIIGWEDWKDNKPIRFPMDKKPSTSVDPKKPVKHFWAFVVWDYAGKRIAILEVTQKSVQNAIQALTKDADWGSPFDYDIKVTKTGSNMETEYTVNPVPHKPVHPQITELYKKTPVNLQELFTGGDPFAKPAQKDDFLQEMNAGLDDDSVPF